MDKLKFRSGAKRRKRYFKRRLLLLIFFTFLIGAYSHEDLDLDNLMCPQSCKCRLLFFPEDGTILCVTCDDGDLRHIPVEGMDNVTFQLIIGAPEGRPNYLTIGPIFTQPTLFSELREIRITNSNVPTIGVHSFWGLQHLRVLNLNYNNITSISSDNFRGLLNLKKLSISHNHIHSMASETFHHCTSLKKLDLSYNKIYTLLPRVFRSLARLESLDLSGNPLLDLNPDAFKDIQHLSIFKCRDCLLSRINAHIFHLAPNLKELDLGYNQIKYILSDDFSNLKRLENLKLDGNQMAVIVDYVFGQNRQLISLDVSHNKLAMLAPNSLMNLTKLSYLNIGHNKIERFHLQTFAPLIGSIKHIIFSGNNMPLNEVAILLQIIPDLEGVGLANLSLSEMPPKFFMYNAHLSSIDLSWNKLTQFPLRLLSKLRYLQTLNLSYNHLSGLQEMDLKRLESIPFRDVSKNRWECDQCSAGTMVEYMITSVLNETLRTLRCYKPLKLRGTQLRYLTFEKLAPCPSREVQLSMIAGLVLLLVASLAVFTGVLCCMRRRAQRYYTNEGKRCEHNHEHPEELLPHTELSTLPTIHEPFSEPSDHS